MLGFNKKEDTLIDIRKLKKPKLKGTYSLGCFISLAGFFDSRRHLIMMAGNQPKSPWLGKRQARYDKYTSELYTVAGDIMKDALVKREQVNDELKMLHKELLRVRKAIPEKDYTPNTVAEKRTIAHAKCQLAKVENEIQQKIGSLKEIKLSIDETEHELYQIMLSKKKIIAGQMLTYLR